MDVHVEPIKIYSDDYLNYQADRYVAGRLNLHGVSLIQFLAAPELYEFLMLMPYPLLDKQKAVKERIEAAEAERVEAPVAHLPRRNGTIVEPLHHTRHHRRRQSAFFPKGGKA